MKGRTKGKNYKEVYPDGINSNFWQRWVAPMVKELKGNICKKCGAKENIDIHHLSYKDVNINTLMLLCRSCHLKEHNILRGGFNED